MVRKHVWQEEPARKGCTPPIVQCAYAISSEQLRLSRDTIHGNGVRIRIRNDEKYPPWMHPRQAAHRLSGHALLSMFIYALIPMARRNAWRYRQAMSGPSRISRILRILRGSRRLWLASPRCRKRIFRIDFATLEKSIIFAAPVI